MAISLARPFHVSHFDAPSEALPRENGWCFEQLAGRLVQLEGTGDSAALTLAFSVILEAQFVGEPAAWVTVGPAATRQGSSGEASAFYPPDAHDNGVDLAALPVVRVPGVTAAFSAADLLLRSGGFGLIVADLGVPPAVPSTALARLAGLARRHQTAMVFLTQGAPAASRGSLGSLISMHARARRRRAATDRFDCAVVALKDKHRGPAWQYVEVRHGASGLR